MPGCCQRKVCSMLKAWKLSMEMSCSVPDACRLEDLVPQGCWHCLGDAQLARAISSPDFLEKLRAGKRVGHRQGPGSRGQGVGSRGQGFRYRAQARRLHS